MSRKLVLVSSRVPADPTVGGTVVGEGADTVQVVRRAGVRESDGISSNRHRSLISSSYSQRMLELRSSE
jgi:hypothetical protein